MKYVLYVDMKTVHCREVTIEKFLEKHSRGWEKICNNFWGFENEKDDFSHKWIGPPEHYMNMVEKYAGDDCMAFIASQKELDNNHNLDYICPQSVIDYLFPQPKAEQPLKN